MTDDLFLPGVPEVHVRQRMAAAGGNEIESGKFAHPESSAALAANAFGWFIERPASFPALPGTEHAGAAHYVDVEFCARFPWSGGRHPWLDAMVETPTSIIGVESKRFEPFRDTKTVSLSDAYDRPVWGDAMARYEGMRDRLRDGRVAFQYLDGAQLVKHALGLVTEARRRAKQPILFYLYTEPWALKARSITSDDHARHRDEIAAFANSVSGDEVAFGSASYREWLQTWLSEPMLIAHADALTERFNL